MPDDTPPGGASDQPPSEPPPGDTGPSWSPVPPEAPPAHEPAQPAHEPAQPAHEPAQPAHGFSAGDPLGGSAPAPQAPAQYGGPPPGYQQPATPTFGTYELSGWWRRAGALIIDSLIVGALAFAVTLIVFAIIGAAGAADSSFASASAGILIVVLFLGYLAAAILYQPVIMARTNGKTFGKMATGIRVVRVNGERCDLGWAALRQVVVIGLLFGWVGSFFLGIPLILDYLWPLWDSENRALHDMLVQSRVVRT
jgi:uncharacterized RDD family membrane protein YckC